MKNIHKYTVLFLLISCLSLITSLWRTMDLKQLILIVLSTFLIYALIVRTTKNRLSFPQVNIIYFALISYHLLSLTIYIFKYGAASSAAVDAIKLLREVNLPHLDSSISSAWLVTMLASKNLSVKAKISGTIMLLLTGSTVSVLLAPAALIIGSTAHTHLLKLIQTLGFPTLLVLIVFAAPRSELHNHRVDRLNYYNFAVQCIAATEITEILFQAEKCRGFTAKFSGQKGLELISRQMEETNFKSGAFLHSDTLRIFWNSGIIGGLAIIGLLAGLSSRSPELLILTLTSLANNSLISTYGCLFMIALLANRTKKI